MASPNCDLGMDSPAISRSGRVLKKSAKVKEMEDLDIPELEAQLKSRKKSKGMDDFEEFDDKRIAPLKIPKISLSLATSPVKKKILDNPHSLAKVPPFPSPVKTKLEPTRQIFQESSPEASRASGSSSGSSESSSSSSSSSSSDESEMEFPTNQKHMALGMKPSIAQTIQRLPTPQDKVIVESYGQFNSPVTFVDQNNELAMYGSEGEASDPALIIAEESNDSPVLASKPKKPPIIRKKPPPKSILIKPTVTAIKGKVPPKRRPVSKDPRPPARKKKDSNAKSKPLTAYSLWCNENRKRIVSQNPIIFSSISKKMAEIWQALPDKEKMAWRRKAKKIAMKGSSIISTGRSNDQSIKMPSSPSSINDDTLRGSLEGNRTVGTTPIDVAAYLKLLGESLSIIGQRLTEHEGQIAVSGIFSVLLDSTLCALGPLLCLTSEAQELDGCPQETHSKVLDNIAYFMPGL